MKTHIQKLKIKKKNNNIRNAKGSNPPLHKLKAGLSPTKNKTSKNKTSKNNKNELNKLAMTNENKKHINMNKNVKTHEKIKSSDKSNRKLIEKSKMNSDISKIEYFDNELNAMAYQLAIKYDKRNYVQYYLSLLRNKHMIFYFIPAKDYNIYIVKISLFIVSLSVYFTINAMFFDDNLMHSISLYKKFGSYSILYNIPILLYSSIISIVLRVLLKNLALSGNEIMNLNKSKTKKQMEEETCL